MEPSQILWDHVDKRYENRAAPAPWCLLPEIPTKDEIMPKVQVTRRNKVDEWNKYMEDPEYNTDVPRNIIDGPWPSSLEYIGAHYQILREDAISPLRRSVEYFSQHKVVGDTDDTYVYSEVHVTGLNLAAVGAGFTITFSTNRAGKRIRWEQSKRLQQGTIVALSPESDMFSKKCKIAIVAARPLSGLEKDPPEIDLFWSNPKDAVIDPAERFIMIEARTGYWEASRHMLVALQKLPHERFPLQYHLAALDTDIGPPESLENDPIMHLGSLTRRKDDPAGIHDDLALGSIDVLGSFPAITNSSMDASQMAACKRILTQKLAIVQGPPGTGKTFTSVAALKVLIENAKPGDPPIIIAAQTNHAVDQLLNHILTFEDSVLRLGGRSSLENKLIQEHTLYNMRQKHGQLVPNGKKGIKTAKAELQTKIELIKAALEPLLSNLLLTDDTLRKEGLITVDQQQSLYESGWVTSGRPAVALGEDTTKIGDWLTEQQLVPIRSTPMIDGFLQWEELDEDIQQQKEQQQQEIMDGKIEDEREIDALVGEQVFFHRSMTGASSNAVESAVIKKLIKKHSNLNDIPPGMRGAVYRYWERQIDKKMAETVQPLLEQYEKAVRAWKVTKWECNIRMINYLGIKVIGCTTTGLAKYRGLLSALHPKTLLIEEAAETLEGTIIAGMLDTLERLILVGDHKQLQAHCNVQALEQEPYHLNTSMFERLVNNGIPYTMLNEQRRMISDVRKLLTIEPDPFYHGLKDHYSVLDRKVNRPPVPGMGDKNVYFFHHNWPEAKNPDFSVVNHDEAEMIAGLFHYLYLNGTPIEKITVLSFYAGQKKKILHELKHHPGFKNKSFFFNVHTVDSFQGEENDIILLSLVRSNLYLNVGFLESQNRLVVALSRARRGLYLFGNMVTLVGAEASPDGIMGIGRDPLWGPLASYMKKNGQMNIDLGLPITCQNHGTQVIIDDADGWSGITAGCELKCEGLLNCGHACQALCHPGGHKDLVCMEPCPKNAPCGHGCSRTCGEQCHCQLCAVEQPELQFIDMNERKRVAGEQSEPQMSRFTSNDIRQDGGAQDGKGGKGPTTPRKGQNLGGMHFMGGRQQQDDARARLGSPGVVQSYSGRRAPVRSGGAQIGSPSSRKNTFTSPRSSPFADPSTPGSAHKWNEWDAKKADQAALEEYRASLAANHKPDGAEKSIVYKETFRQVKVQDGRRMQAAGTVRQDIGRSAIEGSSATNRTAKPPPPQAPKRLIPQAKLKPVAGAPTVVKTDVTNISSSLIDVEDPFGSSLSSAHGSSVLQFKSIHETKPASSRVGDEGVLLGGSGVGTPPFATHDPLGTGFSSMALGGSGGSTARGQDVMDLMVFEQSGKQNERNEDAVPDGGKDELLIDF